MNRVDRLSAILIHLQSKSVVTAAELAERFCVSKRTIYRDLKALDEAGVPLGGEAGKGYYLVEGYHLPPIMFSRDEASAFMLAGKLMDKHSDTGISNEFNSGLFKIRSVLHRNDKEFLQTLEKDITVFHHEALKQDDFPDDFIPIVMQALAENRVIQLTYRSAYSGQTTKRKVKPLSLVYYSGGWHLIAKCLLRDDYRDFRLDRIKAAELTNAIFTRKKWDVKQFFSDRMAQQNMQLVRLRFSKDIYSLVSKTRYYFGYVAEKDLGHAVEMDFWVNNLDYIAGWLLSLENSVTVDEPLELHQIMIDKIHKLRTHYKI
ncbi:MAG: YafY family transcriptional regulator [Marinilabiliaceae bacterium]|nr:YafY family transcriptional regulator [Marinilabiliaceae bacterium]